MSDGAFDITYASVGYLYDYRAHKHPTESQIQAALPGINWHHVVVDPAASTIRFSNDATNNTVQNCTIRGSETGTASGTIFFSTGTSTGNDGNTITANTISSAGAPATLVPSGSNAASPFVAPASKRAAAGKTRSARTLRAHLAALQDASPISPRYCAVSPFHRPDFRT